MQARAQEPVRGGQHAASLAQSSAERGSGSEQPGQNGSQSASTHSASASPADGQHARRKNRNKKGNKTGAGQVNPDQAADADDSAATSESSGKLTNSAPQTSSTSFHGPVRVSPHDNLCNSIDVGRVKSIGDKVARLWASGSAGSGSGSFSGSGSSCGSGIAARDFNVSLAVLHYKVRIDTFSALYSRIVLATARLATLCLSICATLLRRTCQSVQGMCQPVHWGQP